MTASTSLEHWPAPYAEQPVRADVAVPGSKSVTNRALLLAALADAPSRLTRPLRSRDTTLMAAALTALGAGLEWQDDGCVVRPGALRGPAHVDVGLAGTVMRFVPPLATLARGDVHFDGDPRARERPLGELLRALRALGADVDDGGRGALPVTVRGQGGLRGGDVEVDASASSQIVSALLLSAPRWDEGVRVRHVGRSPVPNAPHLRMTAQLLRRRGVVLADDEPAAWSVEPGPVAAVDEVVEPDLSSAAPFAAAAVVTGGEVRIRDWPVESSQPGAALPELLAAYGATSQHDGTDLVVRGPGEVVGVDLDLRDAGELVPVLAAVAATASGRSVLRGIGYLRGHETDRLAALAAELGGLGCAVTVDHDGLTIDPAPLRPGVFRTYADHRLAMAGAVLGLVVRGLLVEDVATTGKTYPGFAAAWSSAVTGASG